MDALDALDELAKLQQILLLTRREYDQYRLLSSTKLARAKQKNVQLEQSRDELRSAVQELSEQVERSKSLSLLPSNAIYIPSPIQPLEPSPPKLLTHQDEAYLAAILSTVTSDLAHLKAVSSENERQYQITIAILQAQLAHRDLLLHIKHESPRIQHHKSTMKHVCHTPPQFTPEEALQYIHKNEQLEEEVRLLGQKLFEARQQAKLKPPSPHPIGSSLSAPKEEPPQPSGHEENELQHTKSRLATLQKEVEHLRTLVQVTNLQLEDPPSESPPPQFGFDTEPIHRKPRLQVSTATTEDITPEFRRARSSTIKPLHTITQDPSALQGASTLSPSLPSTLSSQHSHERTALPSSETQHSRAQQFTTAQTSFAALQIENCRLEDLIASERLPPPPSQQIGESFENILLLEEECLRLQSSNQSLLSRIHCLESQLSHCKIHHSHLSSPSTSPPRPP